MHIHIHIYTYMHIHMYYIFTYIYIYMLAYLHIHMHIFPHTYGQFMSVNEGSRECVLLRCRKEKGYGCRWMQMDTLKAEVVPPNYRKRGGEERVSASFAGANTHDGWKGEMAKCCNVYACMPRFAYGNALQHTGTSAACLCYGLCPCVSFDIVWVSTRGIVDWGVEGSQGCAGLGKVLS